MEEQGKRLLIAVALAFGLMFAWNYLFPAAKAPPPKPAATETDTGKTADGKQASDPSNPGAPNAVPPKVRGAEKRIRLASGPVAVEFTTYGGVIRSWQLTGEQFRDRKTKAPYEMLRPPTDGVGGALNISFSESNVDIPVDAEWQVVEQKENAVTLAWEDAAIRVEKRFTLVPEQFRVVLDVRVNNRSQQVLKQTLVVSVFGFQNPSVDDSGGWTGPPAIWRTACLTDEANFYSIQTLLEDGPQAKLGSRWVGLVHSYFLIAQAPDTAKEPLRERIGCSMRALEKQRGTLKSELIFPTASLAPGDTYDRQLTAYFGPKFLDKLERISAELPYKPGLDEAVNLGFWAFFARPLLWLLQWFQSFVGNWGIAIILLTITVKLATLYWTHKSMRSMQEMAKLKPQLEKLKEKYKEDKQRQQVETMALFKAHNVNPLAGCLPMLLQMPVWFALYRALTVAAELYNETFIPGWIDNLTAPDPFYILPVVLTATMFLQSRVQPQTATGAQQKILMYGMPLMFGIFSFFFPAGLTLYIFTNTLLSLFHSLYMHRGRRGAGKEPLVPTPEPVTRDSAAPAPGASGTAPRPKKKNKKGKRKG